MLQSPTPMSELLRTLVSFPTVPLTVAMGVVLLYWLVVVLGGAAFDGAGDGVAASAKATGEALNALKGSVEGIASKEGFFEALGFGQVPVTVSVSLFTFIAWSLTWVGTMSFKPEAVALQAGLLVLSLVVGLGATSIAVRPLAKLFASPPAARRVDLVGRVCQVTSGKVDAGFGTAEVLDGGHAIAVHIVCSQQNSLLKGSKALVVSYDEKRDVFEVESLDFLEPTELEALEDPNRRHEVLARRIKF
jgi:hypothetical protein